MQGVPRPYRRSEQTVDLCLHLIGLAAAAVGAGTLMAGAAARQSTLMTASVAIYGVALLAMISASALYNAASSGRRREWLRRCDHAAIFFMIAGTYTPFTLVCMGGAWGFGIAFFVWSVALVGMAVKLLAPHHLEGFSTTLYLALGCVILVAFGPFLEGVPHTAVILLAAGGLLYSSGIIFHLWTRLPYHNAIWHGFVFTAAACHWVAVLDGVVQTA